MTIIYGNRTFPRPHEWADDRPALIVASWPKALRFIAMQLSKKGCWLAYPIEMLAKEWGEDPAADAARLNDIMPHADLLTEAQVSYLRAAITELRGHNDKRNNDTEADDPTGN